MSEVYVHYFFFFCCGPQICSHYNTGDGSYGNCIYQSKCTKLHVCRHYILEDCLYHNSCKRSHDFLAPNMKKLLSSKGFGDHMTDLLGMLRKAAHMQDAMRADAATGMFSSFSCCANATAFYTHLFFCHVNFITFLAFILAYHSLILIRVL